MKTHGEREREREGGSEGKAAGDLGGGAVQYDNLGSILKSRNFC